MRSLCALKAMPQTKNVRLEIKKNLFGMSTISSTASMSAILSCKCYSEINRIFIC